MRIKRGDGLNIIPLIDVMLVLLAIVLSVSTFIAQGHIKIAVPQADSTTQSHQPKKQIVISVDSNNQIYLDNTPTTIAQLKQSFAHIDSNTSIKLQSDKESRFEIFVQILDILKDKQYESLDISTKKN
ncbi:TonB system transport protein ExbD [Helicobacter enhydrae]|uniref:Biopolymer transport protein ExbD n=1 Tax=Helicobacter enhydrae TaxID=222136 RepID=A0A1B1U541_9HELI|nr:TonB system transport protein ExbD [Helicobacter enhydrae]ANV97805.1 TonB system transport protein ExbD [Helicobacter enhydrae]